MCWATMLSFGREGYVQATRDVIHTTKYIEKGYILLVYIVTTVINLPLFFSQIEKVERFVYLWTTRN